MRATRLLSGFLLLTGFIGFVALLLFMKGANIPASENFWGALIVPSANPILKHELAPNVSVIYKGYTVPLPPTLVQTSVDGNRDYYYPLYKRENVTRVVGVGDSVMFGQGVELEETYLKVAERLLNMDKSQRYEVINLAVPGYGLSSYLELLLVKGVNYHPDIVVVGVVNNDDEGLDNVSTAAGSLLTNFSQRISGMPLPSTFKRGLDLTLREREANLYHESGDIQQVRVARWRKMESLYRNLAQLGRDYKFSVILVVQPMDFYEEETVSLGKALGFGVLRLSDVFSNETFPQSLILSQKDTHYNRRGHELIGRNLAEIVSNS